jgi:hypothetical protein
VGYNLFSVKCVLFWMLLFQPPYCVVISMGTCYLLLFTLLYQQIQHLHLTDYKFQMIYLSAYYFVCIVM